MRLEPPSWWYRGSIPVAAWSLLPASALYGAIVRLRFRMASPYRSELPVICVGNFTLGGAGKTPVAIKLASLLQDRGRRPAFLTRGYGGAETGPYRVSGARDAAEKVGDEALLLAEAGITVVSRHRPAGALLLEKLEADTIVMDDGFQNPSLAKNFSLIVVDAGSCRGCGRVFPLGHLRAPLRFQMAMADAILFVGNGAEGSLRSFERSLPSSCPSPRGEKERPNCLSPWGEDWGEGVLQIFRAGIAPVVTDAMRERPYLAFCGIGHPQKFFGTLQDAGIEVQQTRSFPDHHPFSEEEAKLLIAEAQAQNAGLITTEKDHVRLKGHAGARAELYRLALPLPITIEFAQGHEEALMGAILARI